MRSPVICPTARARRRLTRWLELPSHNGSSVTYRQGIVKPQLSSVATVGVVRTRVSNALVCHLAQCRERKRKGSKRGASNQIHTFVSGPAAAVWRRWPGTSTGKLSFERVITYQCWISLRCRGFRERFFIPLSEYPFWNTSGTVRAR
jgi:hypothetical protein